MTESTKSRDSCVSMDGHTFRNETTARCDTRIDLMFLLFNCTVLSLTLVLGLPGNLWVCWVVFRTKSLQTCNNALFVSLAAGDFLKCSVDTPLLLFSLLRYQKHSQSQLSVSLCALQQFTYALCSCVQLLTLVSISVDRFQVIAFPFQTDRRKTRVRLWMLFIWTCGLILAIMSLTLSENACLYMLCRPHIGIDGDEHGRYSDPFGPYVLVPVWALSLTLIVIHYVRIFRVVRKHRNKVFNRRVQLRPTVSERVWCWLNVPASAGAAPQGLFRPLPPVGPAIPLLLAAEAGAFTGGAPRSPPKIVGSVCPLKPGAREWGNNQMEGKLALRFGYTIIAFTLFWAPMVVILLLNIIFEQNTDGLSSAVFLFLQELIHCNAVLQNFTKMTNIFQNH